MSEFDSTAVRVALWRAMHVRCDDAPHVLEDEVGLKLAAPPEGWMQRPDMHPQATQPFRASIDARARFIEDLVQERAATGVRQYVILGAGLDTFAQRHPEIGPHMTVFEIDQPGTQQRKRERLQELGLALPAWLKFVPVDFEARTSWREALVSAGFDSSQPAVVACTGVSMYLTHEAVVQLLRDAASLAPGSVLALSFLLPLEMADPGVRQGLEMSARGARASGTPFISFFEPGQMLQLAKDAGFAEVRHVSAQDLAARYFSNRSDGLTPPRNAEELLVAVA